MPGFGPLLSLPRGEGLSAPASLSGPADFNTRAPLAPDQTTRTSEFERERRLLEAPAPRIDATVCFQTLLKQWPSVVFSGIAMNERGEDPV